MTKTKRGISSVLAAALLCSLCACSGGNSSSSKAESGRPAESSAAEVTTAEAPTEAKSGVDELLDGIHYGTNGSRTADPLNATLYKLGGSAISNGSYVWSCLRNSSNNAWNANGNNGFFNNNNMYNSNLAVPLSN